MFFAIRIFKNISRRKKKLLHATCRDCTTHHEYTVHASQRYRPVFWNEQKKNVLSCTSGWPLFRRGRVAMQERRKRRRRGRKEGSEVSGTVVHSTLPVSVCLPEQHSPTAQPRKGTRGGKRRDEERVEDTRTPRRINHHKKQRGNSR